MLSCSLVEKIALFEMKLAMHSNTFYNTSCIIILKQYLVSGPRNHSKKSMRGSRGVNSVVILQGDPMK